MSNHSLLCIRASTQKKNISSLPWYHVFAAWSPMSRADIYLCSNILHILWASISWLDFFIFYANVRVRVQHPQKSYLIIYLLIWNLSDQHVQFNTWASLDRIKRINIAFIDMFWGLFEEWISVHVSSYVPCMHWKGKINFENVSIVYVRLKWLHFYQ